MAKLSLDDNEIHYFYIDDDKNNPVKLKKCYLDDILVYTSVFSWNYRYTFNAPDKSFNPISLCKITNSSGTTILPGDNEDLDYGTTYNFTLGLKNGVRCSSSTTFSNIPSFTDQEGTVTKSFTCIEGGEVNLTLSPIVYTLNIVRGEGVGDVKITRNSSPMGGSLGEITTSSALYYGDKLQITAYPESNQYEINSYSSSITITENTTISITAKKLTSTIQINVVDITGLNLDKFFYITQSSYRSVGYITATVSERANLTPSFYKYSITSEPIYLGESVEVRINAQEDFIYDFN